MFWKKGIQMSSQERLTHYVSVKLTKSELESWLWGAANILRDRVEYMPYILTLLFYKRLTDTWREEYEATVDKLLSQGFDKDYAEAEAKLPIWHRFQIPEGCFWEDIRKVAKNVGERLNESLRKIAEVNPKLQETIDRVDFNASVVDPSTGISVRLLPDHTLRQLVQHFSTYRLDSRSAPPDVLGDAYEYLIRQFALRSGKEGGEMYTPPEVREMIIGLLDPQEGESVYDPAAGSPGMLITAYYYVKRNGGDPKRLFLYGQEVNELTWRIARINIVVHGMEADVRLGDTLLDPKFVEDGKLMKFDVCVSNVPWNQKGYSREMLANDPYKRFRYGLPPSSSMDWAWIQHMLASIKRAGRMGIVLDNGALFRSGAEKQIRAGIIEEDLLEAVVGLPEKLFYNTGAPACIMIFNRNKPRERRGKVLFINATRDYEERKKQNKLRDKDIQKAVNAYREFAEIGGYSRIVTREEIKDNDYDLNVTLYVMPIEEKEAIDIARELSELRKLERERQEVEERLERYASLITQLMGGEDES